jgi:hypothetical protein
MVVEMVELLTTPELGRVDCAVSWGIVQDRDGVSDWDCRDSNPEPKDYESSALTD